MLKQGLKKLLSFKVIAVLLLATTIFGLNYLYKQNKAMGDQIAEMKKDPQGIIKEQTAELVAKVNRLVALPSNEEPVVATVTDKDKLKDQPLFAKAENGDKILIFSKAKKAYVYRPSSNLLIDVLPINTDETGIPGVDETHPLRLALYNGTATPGLTSVLEDRINEQKILGISVSVKANAALTYDKTEVIDLTGKRGNQAQALARMLNGEVATETAEYKPNADLLVIIGKDFK